MTVPVDHLGLRDIHIAQPSEGVVLATLDRPARLNALTNGTFAELERLAIALRDAPEARALIITGAGRGFCAGFDLDAAEGLAELPTMTMGVNQDRASRSLVAIRSLPIPVVAAINGPSAGGGLALALACDMRFGGTAASFTAAFVRIGLSCGDLGTSWLLPRIIGPGRAADLVFTGRTVDAREAQAIGLLDRVVEQTDLVTTAVETCKLIAGQAKAAVQFSKRALQANSEVPSYAAAIELENRGQVLLTRDMGDAVAAFRAAGRDQAPPREQERT